MPTYQAADDTVKQMADALLRKHETHKPIVEAGVKVDYVFAYPDLDENDQPTSNAIKVNGYPAAGMCRILNLKDRAMGRADAEITLDYPHWEEASTREKEALLDHELHHITLGKGRDDLQRPKLRMRKHDVQVGWFTAIAERHGTASCERIQAVQIMEKKGQYYWPEMLAAVNGTGNRTQRVEVKK